MSNWKGFVAFDLVNSITGLHRGIFWIILDNNVVAQDVMWLAADFLRISVADSPNTYPLAVSAT